MADTVLKMFLAITLQRIDRVLQFFSVYQKHSQQIKFDNVGSVASDGYRHKTLT